MNISENGLNLIKSFEGFSSVPYLCPAGKMTVGYGHVIKKGELCDKITESEAMKLLLDDVKWVEKAIQDFITVFLTQNQYDALCSFIYNVGKNAFANSTLLALLNDKEYGLAADQFSRWCHIGKEVSAGLLSRRNTERALFEQYA